MELAPSNSSHGGLIFPLDAFRPTMLAAAFAELLVGKARNIIDTKLELTRHVRGPLVLARLHGAIVDDDPANFWAENPELCVFASQILPRQCFAYYVSPAPNQRQGFLIAQQGQPLAKEDGTVDTLPAGAKPEDWPVARLCQQLQLSLDELASGFEGGPRIEVGLLEPVGNDQDLLRTLAGAPPEGFEEEPSVDADADGQTDGPADSSAAPTPANPSSQPATGSAGAAPRGGGRPDLVAADLKRRATERETELRARQDRAAAFAEGLPHEVDDFGIVVAPEAELGDTDLLTPYLQRHAGRDLPAGVPKEHASMLEGRRIDFAVRVEFLSEVLFDSAPLNKPLFAERAQAMMIASKSAQVLEVLAPRLGAGSLVQIDGTRIFVSRPPGMRLPEKLVAEMLGR